MMVVVPTMMTVMTPMAMMATVVVKMRFMASYVSTAISITAFSPPFINPTSTSVVTIIRVWPISVPSRGARDGESSSQDQSKH